MDGKGDTVGEILSVNEIHTLVQTLSVTGLPAIASHTACLHGDARPTRDRIVAVYSGEPEQRQLESVLRYVGPQHMLARKLRSIVDRPRLSRGESS